MSRICIVTEEFGGINRGGGIGTCSRGLAEHLCALGHEVDILITDFGFSLTESNSDFAAKGGWRVVSLLDFANQDDGARAPFDAISKSYSVYRLLKKRRYDAVHFHDFMGAGFYSAMARRMGLFPATVVTHLHGSSEWVRRHNLRAPDLDDLECEAIERSQIENSDHVVSPSAYLLQWYRDHEVALPGASRCQWILPQWMTGPRTHQPLRTRAAQAGTLKELIFFGRHERRKGFEIFVDAVSALPPELQVPVTFIGRFDRIDTEFTGSLALRKLADHAGSIRFYNDMGQERALAFIRRSHNALCVMPSLIENSPCTIGECLTLGIPFLATDVGGTAELIEPASRKTCLVEPNARALKAAIERVLTEGLPPIISTLRPTSILDDWIAVHETVAAIKPPAPPPEAAKPLVSICVTHFERPRLLVRALDAILGQKGYDAIEIIIVDDGSKSPAVDVVLREIENASHRFPVTVIRSENRYLSAARNLAASHAKGEFLFFHDDDNIAEPHEVATFVSAALTMGADILTAQSYSLDEMEEAKPKIPGKIFYFPIGIGGLFSFFRNRFGDANALIRRSVFEAIGGFTDLYGVGWEDWEFFLKAYLSKYRLAVIPEPLFHYRVSTTGMRQTGNSLQNFERLYAAIDTFPPKLGADLFRYMQRDFVRQELLDRLWLWTAKARSGDLHRQLTAIEPNSAEARMKLSDYAFEIGRFSDAIDLGAEVYAQREKLVALLTHSRRSDSNPPSERRIHVVASERQDALYLRGWIYSQSSERIDIPRLEAAGRWFDVIAMERHERPDVQKAYNLTSSDSLGFSLIAVPSRQKFQWRELVKHMLIQPRCSPIGLPEPRLLLHRGLRWNAHIDAGGWCQEVFVDDASNALEIETERAAPTVLLRGLNQVDFGERISERRSRFRFGGNQFDTPSEAERKPRLLVPSACWSGILFE
jgi:glycosyltransferase involved in cell wall biosynthesis